VLSTGANLCRRCDTLPRSLSPSEFQNLLVNLKEPVNLMVLLAGGLGLRGSEVLATKWEGIDPSSTQLATRSAHRVKGKLLCLPILFSWLKTLPMSELPGSLSIFMALQHLGYGKCRVPLDSIMNGLGLKI
jgi:integrase